MPLHLPVPLIPFTPVRTLAHAFALHACAVHVKACIHMRRGMCIRVCVDMCITAGAVFFNVKDGYIMCVGVDAEYRRKVEKYAFTCV